MYANDVATKRAHISVFGIKNEYQHMGFGRFLMDHCITAAKELGMSHITVKALNCNQIDYDLYRRFGFYDIGGCTEHSRLLKIDFNSVA